MTGRSHHAAVRRLVPIAIGLLVCLAASSLRAAVLSIDGNASGNAIEPILSNANDGDTIRIVGGTYRVSGLEITKSVTIVGVNWPVLASDSGGHIIKVTAPDVHISGLIVRAAPVSFVEDNAGVYLENVHDCVISQNRFENNFFAIYVAGSYRCRVVDNEIIGSAATETQSGNGIHLWYCREVEVIGNHVSHHRDGIYFEFVKHSNIARNMSTNNLRYGLHFMFSDTCTYQNNEFVANGSGVAVMYTHFVKMIGNRFERSWGSSSFGLLLKELSDSEVRDNTFRENSVGIYVEGCNRLIVSENDFLSNGWAVRIMANSMDNEFVRNNFIGNSFQVATDSRQNFSSFYENYWSTYAGYDLNRDGFGDIAYRPVSLFSMVVLRNPPTLVLLHSLTVELMDLAERVIPILTPESLLDERPAMEPIS